MLDILIASTIAPFRKLERGSDGATLRERNQREKLQHEIRCAKVGSASMAQRARVARQASERDAKAVPDVGHQGGRLFGHHPDLVQKGEKSGAPGYDEPYSIFLVEPLLQAGSMSRVEIRDIERLDAAIEAADAPGADRGGLISGILFKCDRGDDERVDPFSDEYIENIQNIYEYVRGERYEVDRESNMIHFVLREPSPYDTHHPPFIGDYMGAVACIIKNMEKTPPGSVLDVGAGWAHTSVMLARCGFTVDAMDVNDRFLQIVDHWSERLYLTERLKSLKLGFDEIDVIDKSYDVILFFESFHHSINHQRLLKNIARILKEDGIIIFAGEPIYKGWSRPWGLRLEEGIAAYCIRKLGWMELGFDEAYFLECLERNGFVAKPRAYADFQMANGYIAHKIGRSIRITELAIREPYASGWHKPEVTGRFTKGRAGLPMRLFSQMRSVRIRLANFKHTPIEVEIFSDEDLVGSLHMNAGDHAELNFRPDPRATSLWIDTPSWCPSDLGWSADDRHLGVHVLSVEEGDDDGRSNPSG